MFGIGPLCSSRLHGWAEATLLRRSAFCTFPSARRCLQALPTGVPVDGGPRVVYSVRSVLT